MTTSIMGELHNRDNCGPDKSYQEEKVSTGASGRR